MEKILINLILHTNFYPWKSVEKFDNEFVSENPNWQGV